MVIISNAGLLDDFNKKNPFSFILAIDLRNGQILKESINDNSLPIHETQFANQIQSIIEIYDKTSIGRYPIRLQFADLQILLIKDTSKQILFSLGFKQLNCCVKRAMLNFSASSL